jgi:hypothetical protein
LALARAILGKNQGVAAAPSPWGYTCRNLEGSGGEAVAAFLAVHLATASFPPQIRVRGVGLFALGVEPAGQFAAKDTDILGGHDADPDPFADDLQHRDCDASVDDDPLAGLSGEDEHHAPP